MIRLGEIQKLYIDRIVSNGAFLNKKKGKKDDDVLLPKGQVPKSVKVGDEIEVFVYNDSQDRPIATVKTPKITIGRIEFLQVVDITKIGAFLDWGLDKDLFLPFKEQKRKVVKGRKYLVGLYIDKSNRLSATMDVYKMLSSQSPYKEGDWVKGTVYNLNKELGVFIAVDNKYHGLIPRKELFQDFDYGDKVEARINKIREDGKLDLSLRRKAYKQIDKDVQKILKELEIKGGRLSLNDNSSPSKIKSELNMSKSAFKRAVGNLLKNKIIRITKAGIEINSK